MCIIKKNQIEKKLIKIFKNTNNIKSFKKSNEISVIFNTENQSLKLKNSKNINHCIEIYLGSFESIIEPISNKKKKDKIIKDITEDIKDWYKK